MSLTTLSTTTNFTIQYEATLPNAIKRAQAIAAVCEGEFAVLTGWFGISGAFGTGDRINVILDLAGGGNNKGYQSGGNSTIHSDAQSANANDANAAEIVKMIFINELVEIFMSYNNQKSGTPTWVAGNSAGEALSQLCGIERFRTGHYLYYGSWVDQWLASGRTDYVTINQPTDKNAVSFGCALLFLYYMKTQLSHSVPSIIQAGAATLEGTYDKLTGGTGGSTAFFNLVNAYFPPGNTPSLGNNDDPFPLLGVNRRSVSVDVAEAQNGPSRPVSSGVATVSPFFTCPAKPYRFTIESTPQEVVCTATSRGFGQPVYTWRVNGVDVSASGISNIPMPVTAADSANPQKSRHDLENVPVVTTVTATPFTSTLVIDFGSNPVGTTYLTIEADASEKFVSPADLSTVTTGQRVDNEAVVWDDSYYRDGGACRSRFDDLMKRLVRYDPFFQLFRTLPDPPPDYGYVERQIETMVTLLGRLAAVELASVAHVEEAMMHRLGMNREAFAALRDVLTRCEE